MGYGYKTGSSETVVHFMVEDVTIVPGDILVKTLKTVGGVANTPCVEPISAGEIPFGVAAEGGESNATAGANSVAVYTSFNTTYEYPPDSGSVTTALIGKLCDIGGSQSIDIDASTDSSVRVLDVDVINNLVICQLITDASYTTV